MKRIATRFLMALGLALMSGAVVLAQQRPSGSTQTQTAPATSNNPATNNPGMNSAEQAQMQQQQNADVHSMMDKAFVRNAAEGGMAEVQLGKLAQEKSTSADVKQFAEKMMNDHAQLNGQMESVAQQMGVNRPKDISKGDKKEIKKLEDLSGHKFDDAYIKYMLKDHKKDLSAFQVEAENTENSQLKEAAQHGAQMIQEHLQMIEQIAKDHNVSG